MFFTWRNALFGRYDVLHLHWPEFMVRGSLGIVRLVRSVLAVLLIARVKSTSVSVVRTLHNLQPHQPGSRMETVIVSALDRSTDLYVFLTDATPVPSSSRSMLIPHGHYRDVLPQSQARMIQNRVLYFGRIEPYKNVEHLIGVFCRTSLSGSLRVVGKASSAMRSTLQDAASVDDRISFAFDFVSDQQMVDEMKAAQIVCLPYTEMHNSGVVLVALSLDRPVLVPRTAANSRLAEEVGGSWVQLFDGALTQTALLDAVESTKEMTTEGPSLEGRDWKTVAELYYQAYVSAVKEGTSAH